MAKQRVELPLVGGHYQRKELKIDAQECVNLYPIIDQSGGRKASLHQFPGLAEWLNTGEAGETRRLYRFTEDVLYAFIGTKVFSITPAKVATEITGGLVNATGQLQIETNGTQIIVLDLSDGRGYVIESDVLTEIASADFPKASSLTYQDGYAIVSEQGTKRFSISTLDVASVAAYDASDFTRWAALEVELAEGLSTNLLGIISDHDELWAMGLEQVGFYYNSANADFPFTKTQHPFQEVGLGGSPASVVKIDNSLFWLDAWNNVRRADGYTPIIISTPEMSSVIEGYEDISDAFAFGHRYAGREFYCLTFPLENITYAYDVLTRIWTLRSSGTDGGRWKANCYADFDRKHLVGDFQAGRIFELDDTVFEDAATRVTSYTDTQRRRITYHRLELHMLTGVGNIVAPGDDPKVMLSWSDDGGKVWSREKVANIGKIGERETRVFWTKCGQSRERVFKIRITDPVKRILIALYADITVGAS